MNSVRTEFVRDPLKPIKL